MIDVIQVVVYIGKYTLIGLVIKSKLFNFELAIDKLTILKHGIKDDTEFANLVLNLLNSEESRDFWFKKKDEEFDVEYTVDFKREQMNDT